MKGICFIEQLFHATIKGRKTQTRRTMEQPISFEGICGGVYIGKPIGKKGFIKPRYKVGEIVYLKEPYSLDALAFDGEITYKFDNPNNEIVSGGLEYENKRCMPAKYARYFIKITAVRCERLQNISDEDCMKEGIYKHISHAKAYWKNGFDGLMFYAKRHAYAALINKINGKGTWESNPYVWVYDYELTDKDN